MVEQFSFKQKECYCGADLTDVKVEVSSNRFDRYPQGKCPECGRQLLLDTDPVMPSTAPPGAGAAGTKRSRNKSKD